MRSEMVNFVATIGKMLVRPGASQQSLQHVADAIVEHLDAALVRVWKVDAAGDTLVVQASAGAASPADEARDRIAVGDRGIGQIAAEMRLQVTNAVVNEPAVANRAWVMREGIAAFGGFPLIVERRLVGVLAVYLTQPMTNELQTVLVGIADEIALAVDYRRLLGELEAARSDVASAEKAKLQFLANMSHEIRTPLNAIVGMTSLLVDSPLTKEQRQYADLIRISSDALLGLVNNMLELSRMESSEVEGEEEAFDLQACVEETLDLLAPQANRKRLELSYSVDVKTPRRIFGDANRLRQVLMNLLANAIKFTHVGEVNVSLTTRARDKGFVEIVMAIRDTGIGIAADRLARMFNPFGQVDAASTRKFGGTHLGLAICKRLCEAMNATIDVVSELGKGSTFTVTLLALPALSESLPHRRASQPHLAGRRVLVVDDNANSLAIVTEHLQTWGMLVVQADSPSDALAKLNEGALPELALVDTTLTGMSATELATAMQSKVAPTSNLPVVLLAPLLGQSQIDAGKAAMSVVTKPIKPAQLYAAVLEALAVSAPRSSSSSRQSTPAMVSPVADKPSLRILVVEDYVINQQVARLMLARLGYQCDVVSNGAEALSALGRSAYDVVLMDLQMPEMDGFETTRAIWQQWEDEERPFIIAITANALAGDRERCLAAGMDYYLSKPVRAEELRVALEAATSRRAEPRNAAFASHVDVFDPAPLEQLWQLRAADNQSIVHEIVQSFCMDTPARIAKLQAAVEDGDLKQVEMIAHSVKSGSGTLGVRRLAALFSAIEEKAEAGDRSATAALAQQLERTFADARVALEQALRTEK